jgi:hypothetical protein
MLRLTTVPLAKINQFDFRTVSLVLWHIDFMCNLMLFKSLIIHLGNAVYIGAGCACDS